MLRVLLVSEHDRVRSSLALLLQSYDIEVVGEATNVQEALVACKQLQPTVILMDFLLADMDGLTATRLLKHDCPETHIIILTSTVDAQGENAALEAGAVRYISKSAPTDELIEAILRLVSDQS